tara:strand:+ start:177644 stop:178408 length:765 start_codon:yes stop_codon:yes gene_type:complete
MTTKTEGTAESIFEQFDNLIDSNIPVEYKELLKSFKEQGFFYQKFIQTMNDKDADLSVFWNLPNTLGFNNTTSSDGQREWFRTFFEFNGESGGFNASLADQFSSVLNRVTQETQDTLIGLQSASAKMNLLHKELGELAFEIFQDLQKKSGSETNQDQLCKIWLQAGEKAFKQISQTDDYIQAQHALFDSLSQLKTLQEDTANQLSNVLRLPSQKAIDDLQKGLHQLRTEFAEYRERSEAEIHELSGVINELKSK